MVGKLHWKNNLFCYDIFLILNANLFNENKKNAKQKLDVLGGERGKKSNPPWVIMDNQEPQALL